MAGSVMPCSRASFSIALRARYSTRSYSSGVRVCSSSPSSDVAFSATPRRPIQRLLDRRAHRAGVLAKRRLVHRHRAPAEQCQAKLGQALLEQLARACTLRFVAGQEDHANRQILDRVSDAKARKLAREEGARDLRQHARAIAALPIGPDAATVSHITDSGERHREDIVAWRAREPGHKANPTRIVFRTRVVQSTPCECFSSIRHNNLNLLRRRSTEASRFGEKHAPWITQLLRAARSAAGSILLRVASCVM